MVENVDRWMRDWVIRAWWNQDGFRADDSTWVFGCFCWVCLADDSENVCLCWGVQRAEELVFKKDEVIEDGKRIATSLQVQRYYGENMAWFIREDMESFMRQKTMPTHRTLGEDMDGFIRHEAVEIEEGKSLTPLFYSCPCVIVDRATC